MWILSKPFGIIFNRYNSASRRRSKTKIVGGANKGVDYPSLVDDWVPPNGIAYTPCKIGSYCMRAYTSLLRDGEVVREYTGYDENPTIADKVDDICSRDVKRLGDKTHSCTSSKLFFTGPIENCDGHVDVLDMYNNTVYTVY